MKKYYYPLIFSGAAALVFMVPPAQASTETPKQLEKNAIASLQNTQFSKNVKQLNAIATPQKQDTQFLKEIEKIDAIARASKSAKKLTLSKQGDTFVLKSRSKSSKQEKSTQLLAQNITPPPSSTPMVPQPEITIEESGSQNVNPNAVPSGDPTTDFQQQATPAAPVLPRAVAPPVGDIAISNIDPSADTIDLGTDVLVPRLVLRQAPAREVLAVLARYAGLNLVFTDEQAGGQAPGQQGQAAPAGEPTVSLDLENESVQEVFNAVLLVSGLKANRRGRTIFVGANLPQGASNLVSRTLRLNQAGVVNAGTVLASQGANFQRVVTPVEEIVDPVTQRVVRRVERPSQIQPIQVAAQTGPGSPLLLSGLTVTADDRLNALTLTGDPRQVQIATSMITQLDARRRQVAVNVKVVDVNLSNTENFSSSFSFGIGDTFFLQDGGRGSTRIGSSAPPTSAEFNSGTGRINTSPVIQNPAGDANTFLDFNNTTLIPGTLPGTTIIDQRPGAPQPIQRFPSGAAQFPNRRAGVSGNPFEAGFTDFDLATDNNITISPEGQVTFSPGELGTATAGLPSLFQYPKRFLAQLEAQITSGNAKILTDPTLVVQEGQEATVRLTEKVLESVETEVDPLSGVRTTTPVLSDAGLTLTVNIERIDDNGFVSLSVSPTVAAPGNTVAFDSGGGSENILTLLNRRELSSGLIRLRDGQTLILSGIIQESDRTVISKVPILGDIPILGALFRSTDNVKDRAEVIVLLTPQIIDDDPRSQFGYNYKPSPEASEILQERGFNPQEMTEEEQEAKEREEERREQERERRDERDD